MLIRANLPLVMLGAQRKESQRVPYNGGTQGLRATASQSLLQWDGKS